MNKVFLFLSFIKTCFHLSLTPLTNRTSIVKVILALRNDIGAGVIGWRRESVLNQAKTFCSVLWDYYGRNVKLPAFKIM